MLTPVRKAPGGALAVLAALLEARTGQQIGADRQWRIETALKPVLRARGLDTLDALVGAIIAANDAVLIDLVIDALLNQETSFFRDAAVIDLVALAIDELRGGDPSRRMRVWSAGCSAGQEPLSLAMLFAEREEASGARAPDIVASDVSAAALARVRAGRFSQFEIQRGLSVHRMIRWFDTLGTDWAAKPDLLRRVSFRRLNLVADPAPTGRFDLILCRNVLLYLPMPVRAAVFEKLAGALRPDGLLVLGAGETVIGQTDAFRPSRRYRGLYEPVAACGARALASCR